MASVFLSYGRDDANQARPLARALEKAGHSVWWDKHISGGSQYAKEIEQALSGADVVVVLWSASSIDSPWVRDEAGSGRDRGRLVPISLEGAAPPLGFRQFQSIDLGGWSGRGKVPRLKEILAAVDRQATEPGLPASSPAVPVSHRRSGPSRNQWALIGLGVGLFFVIVGLLIGRPWDVVSTKRVPTIGTAAADDSAGSKAMAQEVHSTLSSLADVGSGKWTLVADASDKRPDLLFQFRDGSSSGGSKGTLTLLNSRDRSVLWSRDYDLPGVSIADFRQQASLTTARVIGCAVEGTNPGGKPLSQDALKLYLAGCAQLPEASVEEYPSIAQTFEKVVKTRPSFEPAWGKLLLAQSQGDADLEDPASPERRALERNVKAASELNPDLPQIAIAKATLVPRNGYGEALKLLDDAYAKSQDNADLLVARSGALLRVGRVFDAIEDAKKAPKLDPTSPDVLAGYVLALAYGGRLDAAKEELQRAQRLWAGTGRLKDLDYAFKLRFGDPKELVDTEEFKQSPPAWQMYVRTRIDPTPAHIDAFVEMLRQLHARRGVTGGDIASHSQAYGEFHREEEIFKMIAMAPPSEDISSFSAVAFRPALRKFRQEPRFMAVAKRMGLVDYWQKSGKWPDFCFTDPDQPYDCKAIAAKLK